MAKAETSYIPITQPPPAGWITLVEAFPLIIFIVGAPDEAASEIRRALLAGRVRSLRQRFLNDSIEDTQLARTFWRDVKLFAARDKRGHDVIGMRLAEGVDPSIVGGIFYLWQADVLKAWPPVFEPASAVVPTQVKKKGFQHPRIDVAAKRLYPPDGRPPDGITNAALTRAIGAELDPESQRLGIKNPSVDAVRRWRRSRVRD
jgi:hypothetical protein